jgi:hypothetical protein
VHANPVRLLRSDPFDPRRLVFTSLDTLYETRDGGATWAPLSLPASGILKAIEFDPFHPGRLLALAFVSDGEHQPVTQLSVSADGGRHWGAPATVPSPAFALAVPAPDVLLLASANRIFRREGRGAWRKLIEVAPSDERGAFTFDKIIPDPYDRDVLFARGLDFQLHAGTTPVFYRSLDGGRRWTRWYEGSSALAFDPLRHNLVYAEKTSDIFRYLIAGAGARRIGRLTPRDFANDLLVDRRDTDTFFAATTGHGVLASSDGAAHWAPLAPGLPLGGLVPVTDLEQDRLKPWRLYATPSTGGLWRLDRDRSGPTEAPQ